MKYTISKGTDKLGKEFWYCHMEKYPYIPVQGSIGTRQKAKSVCDTYNRSIGKKE